MPRWPKDHVKKERVPKKRGRPFKEATPDKSTKTTQKVFDLSALEDQLNAREDLLVELKRDNSRASQKQFVDRVSISDEINQLRGDINEFKFALQELKADQTSKSWVKELLGKLGLRKVKQ